MKFPKIWLVGMLALVPQGVSSCKSAPDKSELNAQPHSNPAAPRVSASTIPPEQVHAGAPSAPLKPAENAVQSEMRLLHDATRDWVTAIANNTLETIPTGIHKVHGARMVTEEALKKGSYKPPKNGEDLQAFIKQDEAFHDELVKLLQASKARDLPAATKQLGTVLEGCTDCHAKYRF